MSKDRLIRLLESALQEFYTNDKQLFDYKESGPVAERCIVFRIGLYLHEEMMKDQIFQGKELNLDCEYNRHWNRVKRGNNDENVIPDLLIHRRGHSDNNILCVEFKKGLRSDTPDENDRKKLEVFTLPKSSAGKFGYKYGFNIYLDKNKATADIYKDGIMIDDKIPLSIKKETDNA